MSNPADEPPNHLHLLGISKPLLRLFTLRDVLDHRDRKLRLATHSPHKGHFQVHPSAALRFANVANLVLIDFPCSLRQFFKHPRVSVAIIEMEKIMEK